MAFSITRPTVALCIVEGLAAQRFHFTPWTRKNIWRRLRPNIHPLHHPTLSPQCLSTTCAAISQSWLPFLPWDAIFSFHLCQSKDHIRLISTNHHQIGGTQCPSRSIPTLTRRNCRPQTKTSCDVHINLCQRTKKKEQATQQRHGRSDW